MEVAPSVTFLAQLLVSGIALGSIYAMAAMGFNIIYNATGIINFAQGEFVMLGGMLLVWAVDILGWPIPAAILLAMVLVTLLGLAFQAIIIRPLRNPGILTLIIITIGASFLFRGLAMVIWGKEVHSIPQFFGARPVWFLGAAVKSQDFVVWGALLAVAFLLYLFFGHTLIGKAMRACSYNRTAARLAGINDRTMVMVAFGLSAGIGALAGAVIVPITSVEYEMGAMMGLKGFLAAVAGGLGNNPAAVAAGMTLGLLESLSAGYISSHHKDAVAMGALMVVLFIRPRGLFGRADLGRLSDH